MQIRVINLKRLESHLYKASQGELSRLYNIGRKTNPMSGYARSLYHLLTGEKIELEIPPIEDGANERIALKVPENKPFSISPNPNNGEFILHSPISKESLLSITNINGQLVQQIKANLESGKITIDISSEPNGLYLINLRDLENKEILYTQKIIKK